MARCARVVLGVEDVTWQVELRVRKGSLLAWRRPLPQVTVGTQAVTAVLTSAACRVARGAPLRAVAPRGADCARWQSQVNRRQARPAWTTHYACRPFTIHRVIANVRGVPQDADAVGCVVWVRARLRAHRPSPALVAYAHGSGSADTVAQRGTCGRYRASLADAKPSGSVRAHSAALQRARIVREPRGARACASRIARAVDTWLARHSAQRTRPADASGEPSGYSNLRCLRRKRAMSRIRVRSKTEQRNTP